jgi:simple sugar transport system permease protein
MNALHSLAKAIAVPVCAVLTALILGGALIAAAGASPLQGYEALFRGAAGSPRALTETVVKAVPLMLAGLGVGLAFRGRIWNIGAEGQLLMGAVAAAGVGLRFPDLPAWVLLPLTLVASFALGGLWGSIPGVLKARFHANEIVVSLMLNFVAILFVSYLVSGPWRDPASGIPITAAVGESARLPRLVPGTRLHGGIVVALACSLLTYIILFRSTLGFKIRAVGGGLEAARFAGIDVNAVVAVTMALSGGLAGLAGMCEVSGLHYRLMDNISPGYGYTAIVVALMGELHPVGIPLAAILFAGLLVGGEAMHRAVGVPSALVNVIVGLIVLAYARRQQDRS